MPTTQAEDKVKCRFLLDVVVGKGAAVVELLALEDKALLVRGNALLILDLLLNSLNSVGVVDIKSDSLVGKSLNEDLHRHGVRLMIEMMIKSGGKNRGACEQTKAMTWPRE